MTMVGMRTSASCVSLRRLPSVVCSNQSWPVWFTSVWPNLIAIDEGFSAQKDRGASSTPERRYQLMARLMALKIVVMRLMRTSSTCSAMKSPSPAFS